MSAQTRKSDLKLIISGGLIGVTEWLDPKG